MDEDEIKRNVGEAGEDIANAAGGMAGEAETRAHKYYTAARDGVGAAAHTARDAFSSRYHMTPDDDFGDDGYVDRFRDFVRDRPVLAALGATVTGYALAFLIHRGGRRRDAG
ncbi:MAG TPA: hypothetical protein VF286_05525 [Acidiphilium sp.]